MPRYWIYQQNQSKSIYVIIVVIVNLRMKGIVPLAQHPPFYLRRGNVDTLPDRPPLVVLGAIPTGVGLGRGHLGCSFGGWPCRRHPLQKILRRGRKATGRTHDCWRGGSVAFCALSTSKLLYSLKTPKHGIAFRNQEPRKNI